MDRANAVKLLEDTFSGQYDQSRIVKFAKELLYEFKYDERTFAILREYSNYIDIAYSLGTYIDNRKKSIDVLAVKLKKTSSRDRARTMQRNFIAKYLTIFNKDAALVAFYGDEDDDDWRFSFVKMEYNLSRDEEGKLSIDRELTPAKRYSFLVGKNEPNHTCKQQLLEFLISEQAKPTLEEIESAFSIDNVTKEFFERYRDLFWDLDASLNNIVTKNPQLKEEFHLKQISTQDFSKKLLGQIVFIYFLQKKGWLGVQKEHNGGFKPWGSGPKNFLRKLFDKEIVPYNNFFNDILEPLFYEALAIERDDDYYSRFRCKIPFLNGGLFEPINNYDWAGIEITLDNKIFAEILTVFDRFNFTVKEDEPLDKEVAVDPEMLGKVFENLLDVKDRKSKGAFYTPRDIVHYMCQQSLIHYLSTNTSISRGEFETFVQLGDVALSQIIREEEVRKSGKYSPREKLSIPSAIKRDFLNVDKLLKEVKIVDLAVGSGAFPVGMMSEIVRARSILSVFFNEEQQKKRTNYNLKRETIENSLYGVDIEPSAIEIAKLRFWLSLVVDEEAIENVQPLPNLDFNIMCGNSLLDEFNGRVLFDERLLGQKKEAYPVEIKKIDQKIAALRFEKGQIALGKKKAPANRNVDLEIKKWIRKREQAQKSSKSSINESLDESLNRKVRESVKKLKLLNSLQRQHFDAVKRREKNNLRDQIDNILWELVADSLEEQGIADDLKELEQYKKNNAKPFFLWKLYFAEIFQRDMPGFDVVIANPPYLEARSPQFTEKMKNDYQSFVNNKFENGYLIQKGSDLLVYFYAKSLELVRKNGVISFISQNSWLDTDYGKKFQDFLIDRTRVKAIVDSDYKHFETANINTVVTFFIGNEKVDSATAFFLRYHKNFDDIHYSFSKIENNTFSVEDLEVKSFTLTQLRELDHKWGLLLYSDAMFMGILEVMKKHGAKIADIQEINVECGQGLNLTKNYLVDQALARSIDKDALIPIMTNADGAPYELKETSYFLVNIEIANRSMIIDLQKRGIKCFDLEQTTKERPLLILPRGVSRHFCSYNSANAYSSSSVDLYLGNAEKSSKNRVAKRLWLFCNSSLLWLIREISGRKNLGGGMLKAEATDLKRFELYFEFNLDRCETAFNSLKNREAFHSITEISTEEHQEIDQIVFEYLKLTEEQKQYIKQKLIRLLRDRENKASGH